MARKSTLRWVQRGAVLLLVLMCSFFKGYSQNDSGNKGVSITAKKITYDELFDQIRKQTGLTIWYSGELGKRTVKDLNYKNTPLREVLDKVLPKDLNWKLRDNEVIISRKGTETVNPKDIPSKVTTMPGSTAENLVDISGKVTDERGNPIPGATILVKDQNKGTATNELGQFSLTGVARSAIMTISSVGFITEERKVPSTSGFVSSQLKPYVNDLDVTVIKGYYNTTKRLNTGSVVTVTSKEIERQPVGDPMAALIGRVPGMQVTQVSGTPGRAFNVQIRGRSSILSGGSPLYIIDGVPFFNNTSSSGLIQTSIDPSGIALGANMASGPLNSINPADIESIEVLKDADATAIYGSRGGNGVILITTKKGSATKTAVTANFYQGFGTATRKIPLLNTQQYLMIRKEAYKNDNTSIPASAYDINGTWDTTRYTDWQKFFIGSTSKTTDAHVSISGGNERTTFLIGLGYRNEGVIYPGNFGDKRGSGNFSLNHTDKSGRFKVSLSNLISVNKSLLPTQDPTAKLTLPPDAPALYNQDGSLNWQNNTWSNPLSYQYQTVDAKTSFSNNSLGISYEVINGLQIKGNFGYTSTNVTQRETATSKAFSPFIPSGQAYSNFGNNNINIWNVEPQISYSRQFSDLKLDFLAGSTFMSQTQDSKSFRGSGYTDDSQLYSLQSAPILGVSGESNSLYKYNAFFARISANYKQQFLLNLTGRRDGSSRFGPGRQFANFGAVGLAWIFSEQMIFKQWKHILSFGKIRASYGLTGNDQIGDYQYLDTYVPYPSSIQYLGVSTLYPNRLLNDRYAWETNKKIELGLELGFLDNKILLSANYYQNRTSNQLLNNPIASQAGFPSYLSNLDATLQNQGVEINLNSKNISRKHFSWTTNFAVTIPKNKLISFPQLSSTSYANTYVVGNPITIRKSLQYKGIDPKTGVYTYSDVNDDGFVKYPEDYQSIIFTGQQYYGLIQNSFYFHRFNLDFSLQYVRQKSIANYNSIFGRPGAFGNKPTYVLNRWQHENDQADVQIISNSSAAIIAFSNFTQSSGGFSDGSYIRIKNISLSYDVPVLRGKMPRINIFLNAQNLFTITKFKGIDPETGSLLPPLRVIACGAKVTL